MLPGIKLVKYKTLIDNEIGIFKVGKTATLKMLILLIFMKLCSISLECCLGHSIREADSYSHSMVAGGFDDMSYTTRLTPLTLFIMSSLTLARKS